MLKLFCYCNEKQNRIAVMLKICIYAAIKSKRVFYPQKVVG